MVIGGLEKLTVIDFPGKVAAIVFTQSCNFRCHFCYNPLLVWPENRDTDKGRNIEGHPQNQAKIKSSSDYVDDLFKFLESRRGKLTGVVITGGEPTLHKDLPEFIKKIKDLGFAVKLDTNGTNPEMLKNILAENLVDYLAMDIKAPLEKYPLVVGVEVDGAKIKESIAMIMDSGVPYEFRSTIVPGLLMKDDIATMGELIKGADKWFLQKFKSNTELVDNEFEGVVAYTDKDMSAMTEIGKKYVKLCANR
ncbi:MAG: anaerobic ribonucleoside-triphosphate reductase activating protein [Candidatus Falkowbacteria bacterium]